jgi:hypothetical protein
MWQAAQPLRPKALLTVDWGIARDFVNPPQAQGLTHRSLGLRPRCYTHLESPRTLAIAGSCVFFLMREIGNLEGQSPGRLPSPAQRAGFDSTI